MTIKTAGELRKALENISDETPLVKPRNVRVVKAHFLDGYFYTFHYGEGYNCCKVAGLMQRKYELVDALIVD